MTTLSVIIPTRNRKYYLDFLISLFEKVKSQDLEIIIVDNSDISLNLSFTDSRFKYLRSRERLSMTSNFDYGLKSAKGQWRTFIGDDDGIIPDEFDSLISRLRNSKSEAVVTHFAHYRWPSASDPNGFTSIWLSKKSTIRHFQLTGDILRDFNNIYFPMPYTRSVFSNQLEETIRSRQSGEFFTASSPDINSGAAISICATAIDYYTDITPFIVGTSSVSNGSNDFSETKKDFLQLNSHFWLAELGKESYITNYLSYLEPVAQALKSLSELKNLPSKHKIFWRSLTSTKHVSEMSEILLRDFPNSKHLILPLTFFARFFGRILRLKRMLFWAARRFAWNKEKYFWKKSPDLKTIIQGQAELERFIKVSRLHR